MMHLAVPQFHTLPLLGVILLAAASANAGTVTISSPADGATVTTSMRVVASASSSSSIRLMQVYVDGKKVYEKKAASLDTTVFLTAGAHSLTVQAHDASTIFKKSVSVTASTSTTSSSTTSAKTFYNIEQMTSWQSCDSCAGWGGDGPTVPHSMTQKIASPSLDGSSAQFFLGGTDSYSNALWWKQLGGNDSAANFKYDLYFYIKNPNAAQALEFDVNQTRQGKWYIFGTQCVMKGTRRWDVYDPSVRKWIATTIPCEVPKAYTWHHVVFEFRRTTNAGTQFVAVTINGKKHYFNKTYPARAASTSTLNVAFQMDGDKYQTDYNVWLDKVKLTIW